MNSFFKNCKFLFIIFLKKPMSLAPPPASMSRRLLSLDFLRGFIMVLLALESTGLYYNLLQAFPSGSLHSFFLEFTHDPWHGLHFWDLVQPSFMLMAGTAMAYSLHRQQEQGVPWKNSFIKILNRCWWLFFWGVMDYAVRPGGLSFELWDVLTQLSFTTLVAFLVFRWPLKYQILLSLGLLVLTEALYRLIRIPGYNQPFTEGHNFGSYMDLVLMNKINPDGWVAINCIPTAAHTIWGAVAGKILLSERKARQKMTWLVLGGLIFLFAGFTLDLGGITPIIKRIATSSFTLASGGWCLLGLAACYGWIDLLKHRRGLRFFTVVGMNSLLLYLFFEIVGDRWFNGYIASISGGLLSILAVPQIPVALITSVFIFLLEWELCYFLYRKNIFIKL